MPRRDKVDVVCALLLKLQKNIRQAPGGYLPPEISGADAVILAVAALQRAARKEHRAAALCAGDAGLLPEMQRRARDFHHTAAAAKAMRPRAVRPAAARTQRTVGGRLHAVSSPVPIFSRDSVPYFLHLWYNIP